MTVFWDLKLCSIAEIDELVSAYQTTQHKITEEDILLPASVKI
jgi:hypothetical protein